MANQELTEILSMLETLASISGVIAVVFCITMACIMLAINSRRLVAKKDQIFSFRYVDLAVTPSVFVMLAIVTINAPRLISMVSAAFL